ncbi:MAG: hypothetical protein WDW36_001189 [Sanguina aurantia]
MRGAPPRGASGLRLQSSLPPHPRPHTSKQQAAATPASTSPSQSSSTPWHAQPHPHTDSHSYLHNQPVMRTHANHANAAQAFWNQNLPPLESFPDSIPGSTDEPSPRDAADLCVLCRSGAVTVGLLHSLTSTVHYCVCQGCAVAGAAGAGYPCPVCREIVDQAVHVFVVR